MNNQLADRIQHVQERVAAACARSGRDPKEVRTIAVTKYVSLATTGQVLEAGLTHIGENRWQDAAAKWEAFGSKGTWHFIGHLQTNKVKDVIGKFAYIHSLDRLSLAKEIEKKASGLQLQVPCFIQLNVSGEESKYGLEPESLISFVREIRGMDSIRIAGLMTMAPYEAEAEETRPVFRGLREWRDRLNDAGVLDYEVSELSMGMSNDYEVAIEEGATWVRLGSILVGKE
ncbi:YggS family pyridoxal phosphate-dependent enzyme [Paenibacillus validus]|uniref:Pyridoxal phosphate homeostasis protein n=1 Tax=Paenibacillus validus TaxID=44253 RepID=A0A7X3CUD7_9BACL|nr:YggS family pyridoxal phosphate-dependent enzyme [Paenibacillus validus]MED4603631.1 YggS family pyridoxal phosphate-dependent enzyme [Paenibacillus validus]MUG72611.1 YggS family pyridoxal phosphate-dependent enzyme [Paenibacillus validus]